MFHEENATSVDKVQHCAYKVLKSKLNMAHFCCQVPLCFKLEKLIHNIFLKFCVIENPVRLFRIAYFLS